MLFTVRSFSVKYKRRACLFIFQKVNFSHFLEQCKLELMLSLDLKPTELRVLVALISSLA